MNMGWQTRKIWPTRLVEVNDGGMWRTAQMEAWRDGPSGCEAQIRFTPATIRGREHPWIWVDAGRVRARGGTRA